MSRVAIVGAGPTGVALAFLLAERNVSVDLFERHSESDREFRGERLMPGGVEVVRSMGLGPLLDNLPQLSLGGAAVFIDGRLRYRVPFAAHARPLYVPQPQLLGAMVDEATRRFPQRFTFHPGTTLRGLLVRGDKRITGVRVESRGKIAEFNAELVIGTDGRGSLVRRLAGLEERVDNGSNESFDVVWASIPQPEEFGTAGITEVYLGTPGRFATVMPGPGTRMQLGWFIEKGAFGAIRRRGADAWLGEAAPLLPPWVMKQLTDHRDQFRSAFLDVVCFQSKSWAQPGVLLLGDAAHPMSPAGGQGITLGLRDAVVACNWLTESLAGKRGASDLDETCLRIHHERLPEISMVQRLQRRTGNGYFQRSRRDRFFVRQAAPFVARVRPSMLGRGLGMRRSMIHGATAVVLRPAPSAI